MLKKELEAEVRNLRAQVLLLESTLDSARGHYRELRAAYNSLKATHAASCEPHREKCDSCAGTGEYRRPDARTGKLRSFGDCYRCAGKGFMTKGDRIRNSTYDYYHCTK